MAWRKSVGLEKQQEDHAQILDAAARAIAQPATAAAARIHEQALALLRGQETALCWLAKRSMAGLTAPDLLPEGMARIDQITGEIEVRVDTLEMAGHPLSSALKEDELTHEGAWRFAKVGQALVEMRWGKRTLRAPRWVTLALCRGLGYAARQQQLRDEEQRQALMEMQRRHDEADQKAKRTDKERLAEMEKTLAALTTTNERS